jgi:Ca-activated chloride channel family protein
MIKEITNHSEKKELKSQEIARFIPLFYYPLGLALLLFLIATSSMSKREKVNLPAFFILLALGGLNTNLNAGVLDFMTLKEAKQAYEDGNYKKSEELYSKYASSSENSQSYYNRGNALYKQGKYKEAIKSYESARFDNEEQRARNFANIGNSYVKQKNIQSLEEAIKAYENSLKIKEDKDVRENLEAVKKALKEQDQKNKNKQKNNDKKKDNNKDKNNKDKNKENKDEQQDKQNNDKKSDKDSNKNNSKENKDKQDKQKDEKDSKDNKDDKSKPDTKKDSAKELKDKNGSQKQIKDMKDKMSDAEEKKWMKALNENQKTFMYMLNNNNKPLKEDSNEKPW